MKKNISLIFLFVTFSFSAFAFFDFTINSICNDQDILNKNISSEQITLGDLVINLLNQNKINYVGTRDSITKIENSPSGDDAIQILGKTEFRVFGWCYKINDVISENMPNEIVIDETVKSIRWYFGFAHYANGKWNSQCEEDKALLKELFCK
jgi:hypothetical protein